MLNGNKRENISDNRKMLLHTEADGICPKCTKTLTYTSGKKVMKKFEIAHIYPLNPTKEEEKILSGVELLSEDRNDDKNLIALCPECHTIFDKPRTVEGYNDMVRIKKSLMVKDFFRNSLHENNIEDDIKKIIDMLIKEDIDDDFEEKYQAKKVDDKLNDTISRLTKRNIKSNVRLYYLIIQEKFRQLDEENDNTFKIIANQINTYYLKLSRVSKSQEEIFKYLSDWLNNKTNNYSSEACDILISFFIQNCEVF